MRYVAMIEDANGDLVEVHVYCSTTCFTEGTGNQAHGNAWPCPERADYDQYCPTCGALTVPAISCGVEVSS
jgi:hypothetical protein